MSASIDRLGALDHLMLRVSERWPQEICALGILDGSGSFDPNGRFRIEDVRDAIAAKLHLVPRFRQVIRVPPRKLGGPLWVDAPGFEVTDHVGVVHLPAGSGEDDLLVEVEELRRRPMDPSRPLWAMWFVTGLSDGRVAFFVKIHHAIADGTGAMAIVAALLDADPAAPVPDARSWSPAPAPSARALRADTRARRMDRLGGVLAKLAHPVAAARRVRASWPAVRELLSGEPSPETSLNRLVGRDRDLAVIRAGLDEVRDVAHAHGATVNDVLLTATAGGVRALLRSRGEPTDFTMQAYVPVSLRVDIHEPGSGNRISQMLVPLPLGPADPERTLERIARETVKRKARPRTQLGTLFANRRARRWMLKIALKQRVNVITANIHGPQAPLFLAGMRLLEVFPVIPLVANEPLGVGALSYAGAFGIGVVSDRDAVPDVDVFVAGARDALEALGVSTGRPPMTERATSSASRTVAVPM